MQILIGWKPNDLTLHCILNMTYLGSAEQGFIYTLLMLLLDYVVNIKTQNDESMQVLLKSSNVRHKQAL